jgi:hypothetical protein
MDPVFIQELYFNAEQYFRKVKVVHPRTGAESDVFVARTAIRTPREQGGFGIERPWQLEYDWSLACSKRRYNEGGAVDLSKMARKRGMPGVTEWVKYEADRLQRDTGVRVPELAKKLLIDKTKEGHLMGDGSGRAQTLLMYTKKSRLPRKPHRVDHYAQQYTVHDETRQMVREHKEAADTTEIIRLAASRVRKWDPPPCESALQALWGGLGAYLIQAGYNDAEQEDLVNRLLLSTKTGNDFIAVSGNWTWKRKRQWLVDGWMTCYNSFAMPPIGQMLIRRILYRHLAQWAPSRLNGRDLLAKAAAISASAAECLLLDVPHLMLH